MHTGTPANQPSLDVVHMSLIPSYRVIAFPASALVPVVNLLPPIAHIVPEEKFVLVMGPVRPLVRKSGIGSPLQVAIVAFSGHTRNTSSLSVRSRSNSRHSHVSTLGPTAWANFESATKPSGLIPFTRASRCI